jgi:hypothetical protein
MTFGGFAFAGLAVLAACAALFGFPIYFLAKDKARRGEEVSGFGLIVAVFVGALAVAAIAGSLFLSAAR